MELNGIANIKLLVDQLRSDTSGETASADVAFGLDKIEEQLLLLERYMLAIADAQGKAEKFWRTAVGLSTYVTIPEWHEIKENPEKYPTLRDRVNSFRIQMRNKT